MTNRTGPLNTLAKLSTYRLVQEKSSGLFFGQGREPDTERARAWVFTSDEVLVLVREWFGGDHGMELVNIEPCSKADYYSWRGRKAGAAKSHKKTLAVRKNGKLGGKHKTKISAKPEADTAQ